MLSSSTVGTGERTALLHGFTQTKESWSHLADHLSLKFEVTSIDLPNHGDSTDISFNLETGANAIVEVAGESNYVGYSLGARFALTAALAQPMKIKRLVLISGTAGIQDKTERLNRIAQDEELARHLEQIGVQQFIDEWLSLPMFAGLTSSNNQRELRLRNTAIGLSSSLLLCGVGKQQPSWSRLSELKMPVMVIAGAEDTKFVEIANRLVAAIGSNALFKAIANAGHSPHLEQPELVEVALDEFLSRPLIC